MFPSFILYVSLRVEAFLFSVRAGPAIGVRLLLV
jgi:hypothetical protein